MAQIGTFERSRESLRKDGWGRNHVLGVVGSISSNSHLSSLSPRQPFSSLEILESSQLEAASGWKRGARSGFRTCPEAVSSDFIVLILHSIITNLSTMLGIASAKRLDIRPVSSSL